MDSDLVNSFAYQMRRFYKDFQILIDPNLRIYNEFEIADTCNVLVGVYKPADDGEKHEGNAIIPELVVPSYIIDGRMISDEYREEFLKSLEVKPTEFRLWENIIIDPEIDKVLSKECVDDYYRDPCGDCRMKNAHAQSQKKD
jgi:hypothetical protein